jgi:hypothetical protein
MVKVKKLRVKKEQLSNLPLFYNFILHNKLIDSDPFYGSAFSDKFNGIIVFSQPDKLLSKIIDNTKD